MPRNTYKNCKKNKSKSKSHSNKILCPLIKVEKIIKKVKKVKTKKH